MFCRNLDISRNCHDDIPSPRSATKKQELIPDHLHTTIPPKVDTLPILFHPQCQRYGAASTLRVQKHKLTAPVDASILLCRLPMGRRRASRPGRKGLHPRHRLRYPGNRSRYNSPKFLPLPASPSNKNTQATPTTSPRPTSPSTPTAPSRLSRHHLWPRL